MHCLRVVLLLYSTVPHLTSSKAFFISFPYFNLFKRSQREIKERLSWKTTMSITAYICRAIPSARIANEVPYVTRFFGKTAVVLGGETAMEKAKPALLKEA